MGVLTDVVISFYAVEYAICAGTFAAGLAMTAATGVEGGAALGAGITLMCMSVGRWLVHVLTYCITCACHGISPCGKKAPLSSRRSILEDLERFQANKVDQKMQAVLDHLKDIDHAAADIANAPTILKEATKALEAAHEDYKTACKAYKEEDVPILTV